jgi:hypothetical protein
VHPVYGLELRLGVMSFACATYLQKHLHAAAFETSKKRRQPTNLFHPASCFPPRTTFLQADPVQRNEIDENVTLSGGKVS